AADLGVVPRGAGSLRARSVGGRRANVPAAGAHAVGATARTLDVGWADTGDERRAFVVLAGFGIDANMIAETDEELKDKAGWVAYVQSLGKALSASDVIEIELTIDGESRKVDAHTLLLGNCGMLQGGVTLLPDADPADGELDLMILDANGFAGWMDTVKNLVWDNGLVRLLTKSDSAISTENVTHARITSLDVVLGEPRILELDGDEIGEISRVHFEVQPGAIRVR